MALESVYADLLAIASTASRVWTVRDPVFPHPIIGTQVVPDRLHRAMAVALMARETIARLTSQAGSRYKHAATLLIDHFAWYYARETGNATISQTLDANDRRSMLTIGAGHQTAMKFALHGLSGAHHGQTYILPEEHGKPWTPPTSITGASELIAAVATAHVENHGVDTDLADDVDAAYAASRVEWLAFIQSRYPNRGFT